MTWTEATGPLTRFPIVGGMALAERLRTGVLYNPTTPEYFEDPYPMYARLRERDPVHRSYVAGGWALLRYDDVLALLRDARFTADERHFFLFDRIWRRRARYRPQPEAPYQPSMLRLDGADHARLRGLVAQAFTPRSVEKLRPRIETVADELLDAAAARGHMDAIADFAVPLPVVVIAEMLGIPATDRDRFKTWSADIVRILGLAEPEDVRRAHAAEQEFGAYIEALAAGRRREPGDDLLSSLVRAEQAGDRLSPVELMRTCTLLLVAGNETTTNLIGNGLLALLRHPEQLERLRREPGLVENAVEELLRYDSPVQLTSRFAIEDTEFAGARMRRGQQVLCLLGAANRDPARFPDPDVLDLGRSQARHHVAFSQGVHFCLGAQLARLEAQVAFARILRRFPALRLDPSRGAPHWRPHTLLRGVESLPVALV